LYVALAHAPNRTVRARSTLVQPLGALHIVSMLSATRRCEREPVDINCNHMQSAC
jgi:hypothetical protein